MTEPVPLPPNITAPFEDQPLSAVRKITAARLQQAKQTIPHFYLQTECVVDALVAARAALNERHPAQKLTITDFVVRAAALALRKVPGANASWNGTSIRVYGSADIAVAVNGPAGLITPVVRAADTKSLKVISDELKELSERARAGRLKPTEYTGGTFTISNLGMFGVTSCTQS